MGISKCSVTRKPLQVQTRLIKFGLYSSKKCDVILTSAALCLHPSSSPLQAFGFINLILWAGNLWFVFKETGIIAPFMRAPPPQEKAAAPDAYAQQGAYEQDPYASNQGGYQPEYSQQGYNQVRRSAADGLA